MPLNMGQMLNNRYRIVKLLGEGGFGAVYRALDVTLSAPCAVKESFSTEEEFLRQFEREAKTLANLRHPNLPKVTDYFTLESQGQYLVMEYIEGEDLQTLLDQHVTPFPPEQALVWIDQVCAALVYLHNRTMPIIHRDIKPANIRLTADNQAILVDFGLSKTFDATTRTTRGARAITPGFSPPEQYGTGNTDIRSDIYALGATLYALVTGRDPVESIQRTLDVPLPPPSQFNPLISPALEAAILKAMALKPTERFQSAAEFRDALANANQPRGGSQPVTVSPPAGEATVRYVGAGMRPPSGPMPAQAQSGSLPPASAPASQQLGAVGTAPPASTSRGSTGGRTLWLVMGGAGLLVVIVALAAVLLLGRRSSSRTRLAALYGTQTALAAQVVTGLTPEATSVVETQPALAAATAVPQTSPTQAAPASPTTAVLQAATALPQETAAPTASSLPASIASEKDGMQLLLVPAGKFLMGAGDYDDRADPNERPQHTVTLPAFYIDQSEVTNEMYARCLQAGGCTQLDSIASKTHPIYYGGPAYARFPVVNVTWLQANDYCTWAGRRLPTEAEWEKAARGSDGRLYPWGRALDCSKANYGSCKPDLVQVGSYPLGASPSGALDMTGNAWEWVADWFDTDYYQSSPADSPAGPAEGQYRGLRGGAVGDNRLPRASLRYRWKPTTYDQFIGFRCALSAAP
jgi:formylglycine-generating enzyme required for sulfatase activity/predicted Ser/Thr protein kinase